MAELVDTECGILINHKEHTWEWYSGDHGFGIQNFRCPGVDNWQQ